MTPQGACDREDARDAIGCGLPRPAPLSRSGGALRRRAKEYLRPLLDVQTGMRGVHKAYPRELAPRALGGGHRFQHGVVRVTWVLAVVTDLDQAETLRVDLCQDAPEQGRPVRGQRGLPCCRHLAEVHGAHRVPRRSKTETVAVAPSFHALWRRGTLTPSRPTARIG